MEATAGSVGLRINKDKSKIMKVMTDCLQTVSRTKGPTDEVEEFTYVGSVVSTTGALNRMGKARTVLMVIYKLWKSKSIGRATKVRIFNSNVKAVLLHASESCMFTQRTRNRLQVFINKCLCMIVNVHWPDKISNSDLWTKTDQEPVLLQIKRRKWSWLRHTL